MLSSSGLHVPEFLFTSGAAYRQSSASELVNRPPEPASYPLDNDIICDAALQQSTVTFREPRTASQLISNDSMNRGDGGTVSIRKLSDQRPVGTSLGLLLPEIAMFGSGFGKWLTASLSSPSPPEQAGTFLV